MTWRQRTIAPMGWRGFCDGVMCSPVANKMRNNKKEFLVLWKDYLMGDASWTHDFNFDYPKELKNMIECD